MTNVPPEPGKPASGVPPQNQPQAHWESVPPQQSGQYAGRSATNPSHPAAHPQATRQATTRNTASEDNYPDPPRSWKRAGGLLGGWGITWIAVLVLGLAFQVVAQPAGSGNPNDDEPVDARDATRKFFSSILTENDMDRANELQCDDPPDLSAQDVLEVWEDDYGKGARGTVNFRHDYPKADDVKSFAVDVTYRDGNIVQGHSWLAEMDSSGNEVCKVSDIPMGE